MLEPVGCGKAGRGSAAEGRAGPRRLAGAVLVQTPLRLFALFMCRVNVVMARRRGEGEVEVWWWPHRIEVEPEVLALLVVIKTELRQPRGRVVERGA